MTWTLSVWLSRTQSPLDSVQDLSLCVSLEKRSTLPSTNEVHGQIPPIPASWQWVWVYDKGPASWMLLLEAWSLSPWVLED